MHPNPTARTQGGNQLASAVAGISIQSAITFLTRYDQLDGLRAAKSRKKSIRNIKTLLPRAKSNGPSGTKRRRRNSLNNRINRKLKAPPLLEPQPRFSQKLHSRCSNHPTRRSNPLSQLQLSIHFAIPSSQTLDLASIFAITLNALLKDYINFIITPKKFTLEIYNLKSLDIVI